MTRLVFGSLAADMTDLQRFGFASYFSGLSPVITSLSTTLVTARDPGTGTTMAAQGGFDLGTANHASVVTGFSATTAAGQPLFNWTVLNATYSMVQPILTTPGNFQTLFTALLNGADDWRQYSEGGCALVYDSDIAERVCSPSELKRCKGGERQPNASETWLECQARALGQAASLVRRAYRKAARAEGGAK